MSAKTNGLIYFGIGGIFLIICAISFLFAIRSAFVRFHLKEYFFTQKYRGIPSDDLLQRADTETILRKIVDDSVPTPHAPSERIVSVKTAKKKRMRDAVEITKSHGSTVSAAHSINTTGVGMSEQLLIPVLDEEMSSNSEDGNDDEIVVIDNGMKKVTVLGVFRKIKLLALALFLVFFVTFLPFPAMIVSLKSEYAWINDGNWMPVILVLEMNICDYIGRQLFASLTACSFSKKTLWLGCAWRILLYPLFICMFLGIIKNDWLTFAAVALLGITNGHFCCLAFMWAPSLVTSEEQQMCGSIMSFALVMGITVGSYTTLALNTFGIISQ